MSKHRATSRPFSIVLDDVIRSPKIGDSELRLYLVLLSYCQKQSELKTCGISRRALASVMRMSMSGVSKLIRSLSDVGLIKAEPSKGGLQSYSVFTDPPDDICPDELKGRRWDVVVDFVEKSGGLKTNQKRTLTVQHRPKRTGRPAILVLADEGADDVAHQPTSLPLTVDGNTPPPPGQYPLPSRAIPLTLDGNTPSPSRVITLTVEGDPMYREEEYRTERPNGHEDSVLVTLPYAAPQACSEKANPPYSAPTPLTTDAALSTCIASGVDHGLTQDILEAAMVYSPEDLRKERERRWKVRVDGPPRPNTGSGHSDTDDAEPMKERPSKGPKKPAKASGTADVVQELTADPDSVCEAPDSPFHLYAHFCKAVRKKWPDAQFPAHDPKLLKWAKDLLKHYTRSQLYEMIRLVVLDFENINRVRTFFKYRRTPVPTWLFFYGNADTLVSFIGVGVIEPPGIRTSPYADDYARRKNPAATSAEPNGAAPQTSFEAELKAVRASVRARVHGEAPR